MLLSCLNFKVIEIIFVNDETVWILMKLFPRLSHLKSNRLYYIVLMITLLIYRNWRSGLRFASGDSLRSSDAPGWRGGRPAWGKTDAWMGGCPNPEDFLKNSKTNNNKQLSWCWTIETWKVWAVVSFGKKCLFIFHPWHGWFFT